MEERDDKNNKKKLLKRDQMSKYETKKKITLTGRKKNNSCRFTMTLTVQTSVYRATQDNHTPRLRGN